MRCKKKPRSRFGVTIEKSLRDLLKIRELAIDREKYGDAIRAEELRLKATGLLVNKAHVLHEQVDSLTREQIVQKLQEFQELAQKRMKVATKTQDDPLTIEHDNINTQKITHTLGVFGEEGRIGLPSRTRIRTRTCSVSELVGLASAVPSAALFALRV